MRACTLHIKNSIRFVWTLFTEQHTQIFEGDATLLGLYTHTYLRSHALYSTLHTAHTEYKIQSQFNQMFEKNHEFKQPFYQWTRWLLLNSNHKWKAASIFTFHYGTFKYKNKNHDSVVHCPNESATAMISFYHTFCGNLPMVTGYFALFSILHRVLFFQSILHESR